MNSIVKITPLGMIAVFAHDAQAEQRSDRPNIIVILADDMGYSDMGCYGGEIETPNLDRLAQNGLRFSHFYNAGRSCPTRASLLTGLYPHQAGIGRMTFDDNLPGYRGTMTHNGVTIAEVLQDAGYQTGMVGKWHVAETPLRQDQRQWLAHQVQHDEFAPIDNYPTRRGFQDFYGTIYGVVDYFDPFSLVNGETPVTDVPEGYYSTVALADSAAAYIDRYTKSEKPFFLYLSFHSPHWPLHALPEDIAKYENTYKAGWEAIRNARYERIKQRNIFSDTNGCSNESPQFFSAGENDRPAELRNGDPVIYPKHKEALPGTQNVWSGIGAKWANVANTPFRFWKALMYEGGICTPAIACWPAGMKVKKGAVTDATICGMGGKMYGYSITG